MQNGTDHMRKMSTVESPPFEPSPGVLSSHLASACTSLSQYLSASSPNDKAAALGKLAQASQALSRAATEPLQATEEFMNQPVTHACVRVAAAMGVFDALREPAALQQICSATGAECDLMLRIMRALAASGVVQEVGEGIYAQSAISQMWHNPAAKAALAYMDDTAHSLLQLPKYFAKYGLKSPSDPKNTPFVFSKGERDVDVFTLISRDMTSLEQFHTLMVSASEMSAKELCNSFKFDNLEPAGDGDVVLVDVGGSRGQTLNEILKAFPNIRGRIILEDLEVVLNSGTLVPEGRVDIQPYDFFKDVQPITGAAAYLYKWVLHDWPDEQCLTILANLAPAIRGHASSKLLIWDLAIPDKNPSPTVALRDIHIMQHGGKERSVRQWHDLLNKAGFRIVEIHGLENRQGSLIEARLNE